jgi:hypothetical protein
MRVTLDQEVLVAVHVTGNPEPLCPLVVVVLLPELPLDAEVVVVVLLFELNRI